MKESKYFQVTLICILFVILHLCICSPIFNLQGGRGATGKGHSRGKGRGLFFPIYRLRDEGRERLLEEGGEERNGNVDIYDIL